jgi:hypothetical protein
MQQEMWNCKTCCCKMLTGKMERHKLYMATIFPLLGCKIIWAKVWNKFCDQRRRKFQCSKCSVGFWFLLQTISCKIPFLGQLTLHWKQVSKYINCAIILTCLLSLFYHLKDHKTYENSILDTKCVLHFHCNFDQNIFHFDERKLCMSCAWDACTMACTFSRVFNNCFSN